MSGIYLQGKNNIGIGNIDLINDEFEVLLVDTSIYTPDLDLDEYQSDIPNAAVIAEKTLSSIDFSGAVFDANDVVFASLESTQEVGAIVILKNSGAYNTSPLVFINDSFTPVLPDGTDFTIVWDNGPNKIFKL